jgi:hypothetical protein
MAVEVHRIVRVRGSHIFFRQSAYRWPYAPGALPPPPQEDSWYSFLLEAESTPRAIVRLQGLGQFKRST